MAYRTRRRASYSRGASRYAPRRPRRGATRTRRTGGRVSRRSSSGRGQTLRIVIQQAPAPLGSEPGPLQKPAPAPRNKPKY